MPSFLPGINDLATINPTLAKEWHPTKNDTLKPSNVSKGSSKKVWWLCPDCGHEWMASVGNRKNGSGCPACAQKQRYITRSKHIKSSRGSLLAKSPEIAAQWHPTKNEGLLPDEVTQSSNKKVWWICEKGHEWQAIIASRTAGATCPFCSGRYVSSGITDLETLNPELAAQWHPTKNGLLRPSDVSIKSNKKAWWFCPECNHEWQARISSRSEGSGCPKCAQTIRITSRIRGNGSLLENNPALSTE